MEKKYKHHISITILFFAYEDDLIAGVSFEIKQVSI